MPMDEVSSSSTNKNIRHRIPRWTWVVVACVVVGITYGVLYVVSKSAATDYLSQADRYMTNLADAKDIAAVRTALTTNKPKLQAFPLGFIWSSDYRHAAATQAFIETFSPIIYDATYTDDVKTPTNQWYTKQYSPYRYDMMAIDDTYLNKTTTIIYTTTIDDNQLSEAFLEKLTSSLRAVDTYATKAAAVRVPSNYVQGFVDEHVANIKKYKDAIQECQQKLSKEQGDARSNARKDCMFTESALRRDETESVDVVAYVDSLRTASITRSLDTLKTISKDATSRDEPYASSRAAAGVYVSWAEAALPANSQLKPGPAGQVVRHWLDAYAKSSNVDNETKKAIAQVQTDAILLETPSEDSSLYSPSFSGRLALVVAGGVQMKRAAGEKQSVGEIKLALVKALPRPDYLASDLTKLEDIYTRLIAAEKAIDSKTPSLEIALQSRRVIWDEERSMTATLGQKLDDTRSYEQSLLARLETLLR